MTTEKELKDEIEEKVCLICGSKEHTDGRCESGAESWREETYEK